MRSLLLSLGLTFGIAPCNLIAAQAQDAGTYLSLTGPELRIGADGSLDSEFEAIGSVARLPTGEIAVADWRRPVIRVFDRNGRLVRSIGRDGEGPGEFRSVHQLFLVADTLIAYDWQLRRLNWFALDGTVLRTTRIAPAPADGSVDIVDRLPDGRWLVTTPHSPNWNHGHGVYRDTVRVGVLPLAGSGAVQWLISLPGMTFYSHMPSQDKSRWQVGFLRPSANTIVRSLAGRVIVGDNSQTSLVVLTVTGTRLASIMLPVPASIDFRHLREVERDRALAEAPNPNGRDYADAAFAVTRPLPRYQSFLPATGGELWVQLMEDNPDAPSRYLIIGPAGNVSARYLLPSTSRVISVQGPEIFVVTEDSDGLEHLAVYHQPMR